MELFEIAATSYLFRQVVDFDTPWTVFLRSVNGAADLSRPEHRNALLTFLNKWGCRQFARNYHSTASDEIVSWHQEYGGLLPPIGKDLWDLTDEEVTSSVRAYGELVGKTASWRRQGSLRQGSLVHVGRTGAAKILFAVRPRGLLPWDNEIRTRLKYNDSVESYGDFVKHVRTVLDKLAAECNRMGFELAELPEKLGRARTTIPKLIDEYYWITITNGCTLPDAATVQQWIAWGLH